MHRINLNGTKRRQLQQELTAALEKVSREFFRADPSITAGGESKVNSGRREQQPGAGMGKTIRLMLVQWYPNIQQLPSRLSSTSQQHWLILSGTFNSQ